MVEEALEAEVADTIGPEYYENGAGALSQTHSKLRRHNL
jgi:hypothetical protein